MSSYADDPTLLKVRGEGNGQRGANDEERDLQRKEYVKKVSSAVLTVIGKHGSAKLKAVGAPSLSNAVKAAIIARGEGAKKGMDLVAEMSFDNAEFDGSVKTAIVLRIVDRNNGG